MSNSKKMHAYVINTHTYPAKMFSSVLFPAPLGPRMAVKLPELNFPFNDFNICRRPAKS